ncbi:MAG: hypothetical protein ACRD99_00150 [Nitrososphaera sp.]
MVSLLEVYNINSSKRLPRLFLICDFCFWAASATSIRRHDVASCPQCDHPLSRIPLGDSESFTFNYEKRRGVELAFSSRR